MKRKEANWNSLLVQALFYGVLGFYVLILFLLLFGKRPVGSYRSLNLIPFHEIGGYLFPGDEVRRAFGFSNLVGNILIFIPLGVYLPLLFPKRKALFHMAAVAAVSVTAEALQYMFQVGAADIDDVILNTLGGLIGVGIFALLKLGFRENVKKAVAFFAPAGGAAVLLIIYVTNNL